MNRSEEIRSFFRDNPGARPKDCIVALAARGIDVTPTLVSCVRAKLKERPVRDMASDIVLVRAFVDSSGLDPEVAVEILSRFAEVAERVGGLDRFREVLAAVDPEPGPGGGMEDEDERPEPDGDGDEDDSAPQAPASNQASASAAFYYDYVDDEDDD